MWRINNIGIKASPRFCLASINTCLSLSVQLIIICQQAHSHSIGSPVLHYLLTRAAVLIPELLIKPKLWSFQWPGWVFSGDLKQCFANFCIWSSFFDDDFCTVGEF